MSKGLRPPLLAYGLQPALEQLIDDLSERNGLSGPLWEPDFPVSEREMRYDRSIEQHLFRIVQQACENALRHAEANIIQVTGNFTPALVELTIEDDGIGFETNEALDLTYFLSHQHYGIIGMLERAELIGAVIRIESTPQRGTTVHVIWSAARKELVTSN